MSKKRLHTGTMKGFFLLLLIVNGLLYAYHNHTLTDIKGFGKTETASSPPYGFPEKNATSRQSASQPSAQDTHAGFTNLRLELPEQARSRMSLILERTGYTVSYNNFYKTPSWVAWELTRSETTGMQKRKNKFVPDPDLPEPRAEHSDYSNSGYDRGHMAPAADMKWSKRAMEESFYMSNICPQNRKLNRDDWGTLEEACRQWAKKYGRVYIACGPIYDRPHPLRIGRHQIAVPDRFFKVVLIPAADTYLALGFLFENKANHRPLQNYMVSVDSIENITGMDFFAKLPDETENRIEAKIPALPAF